VIGEPPDHLLLRLILDRGSEDGVAVADVVASRNGIYLGRIIDVRAKTSIMAYVSSELNKVTVRVATAGRPLGIVLGQGISGARVDYLEKNIDISVGSNVVTSEREENVPAGFFVGVVERVEPDVTRVFQQAILKLPIGLRQIEEVVVIRSRADAL
jgi:cell shape-determining protein MreC